MNRGRGRGRGAQQQIGRGRGGGSNGQGGESNGRGAWGSNGRGGGANGGSSDVGGLATNMQAMSVGGSKLQGGRGANPRPPREDNLDDIINTMPEGVTSKKGALSQSDLSLTVLSNYFPLKLKPGLRVMQFSLHYKSDEDLYNQTGRKRYLFLQHREKMSKSFLFTGDVYYSVNKPVGMGTDNVLVLTSHYDRENEKVPVEITIKLVKDEVPTNDFDFIQVLNTISNEHCRSKSMRLNNAGAAFFDMSLTVDFSTLNISIWQGFEPTIRPMEHGLMLNLKTANKVVRKDTAYDTLKNAGGNKIEAMKALMGAVIVTDYNNDRTYRIDDIDYDTTPEKYKFEHATLGSISLVKYYKHQYKLDIKDPKQPLLVSTPKKKDQRRGQKGPIYLVPELCKMTGLTDTLRTNFRAMQEMAKCLKLEPKNKLELTVKYAKKLVQADAVDGELTKWGMKIDPAPAEIRTRCLKPETIYFGNNKSFEYPRDNADWTQKIKDGMATPVTLSNWSIIFPTFRKQDARDFFEALKKVAVGLKLQMNQVQLDEIPNDRGQTYQAKLSEVVKRGPNFVLVVINKPDENLYKIIKNELICRNAIPCQVVTTMKCCNRDKRTGGIKLAIATKVGVQIGCKMGATPWFVRAPLGDTMVVGFDVFHNKVNGKKSVGAMTSSYDKNWCQYYSNVKLHHDQNELSACMGGMLIEAMRFYQSKNGAYPRRIFFYRDGVGEGQIQHILNGEVNAIKKELEKCDSKPLLTFIIVSKRIAQRFFHKDGNQIRNPPPGTVVDDVVTYPYRYDFFLVSQCVTQGTVNPTSFNVIEDQNKLNPAQNQMLAYKLCHVYPNWPGTIRVPAPCQLAHKLAYLIGEHELNEPHHAIRETHFFL